MYQILKRTRSVHSHHFIMWLFIYNNTICLTESKNMTAFDNENNTGIASAPISNAFDCHNMTSLTEIKGCYCYATHNNEGGDAINIYRHQPVGLVRYILGEYVALRKLDNVVTDNINSTIINGYIKNICDLYPYFKTFGGNTLIISERYFVEHLKSAMNFCENNKEFPIGILSNTDPTDLIQKQLIQYKLQRYRTYVVFGGLTVTTNVLKIARRMEMTKTTITWVLCFSDLLHRDIIPEKAFSLKKSVHEVDWEWREKLNALKLDTNNTEESCKKWKGTNITMNRHMIEWDATDNNNNISSYITDVKFYTGKRWIYTAKISKNKTQYHSNFPTTKLPNIFRVVTIVDPPFTMIHKSDVLDRIDQTCDIGKLCWKYETTNNSKTKVPYCCIGFCMDLLSHIERDLKFTSDVYIVEDSTYGATVNGTWVGMVGDLVHEKADIIVAALTISGKRSKVISFTDPYMVGGVAIATLLEKTTIPFLNTEVFSPLSTHLWIALFGMISISSVLLVFTERLGIKFENSCERPYTISFSLSYLSGLFFQRDIGGEPPTALSSRVISILVALATLIVMTAYTAVLTANKVTSSKSLPITGFRDKKIINPTSSFKYATIADSVFTDMFKSSSDPDWNKMYHFMKNYNFRNTSKAIENLKNGQLNAIIHDYPVLYHFISKEKDCKIQFAGQSIKDAGYGLAVTKDNSLEKMLSVLLRNYHREGFVRSLTEKWMNTKCTGPTNIRGQKRDGINDFGGLFLLVVLGIGFTFVLLSIEIMKCTQRMGGFKRRNKLLHNVFVNKASTIKEENLPCETKPEELSP